jgi:hypothetical protein
MPRITIRQFRALLATPGPAMGAYRELARRADLAGGFFHNEWAIWSQSPSTANA